MSDLEMVGRLAAAALCGGLIGLERERGARPAGLRTMMVVSVGAALIMIVSFKTSQGHPAADPGRIAAQVVSGIGFLGAGAIIRFGMSVKGLTTAASIWTSAGIGLAAGMGYFKEAGAATILVLIVVYVFDKLEHWFLIGRGRKKMVIQAADGVHLLARLEKILEDHDVKIKSLGIQRDLPEKKLEYEFTLDAPVHVDIERLSKQVAQVEEVQSIDID